jgi:hypothetical protein
VSSASWAALAAALLLAACGGLPQPHRGNPGGAAPQLVVPLAVRLAVAPPAEALLPEADATRYAEAVSEALQAQDIPATATGAPLPLDWRLVITASVQGGRVQPRYRILDADGGEQGVVEGTPVPAQAWAAPTAETLDAVAQVAAERVARLLVNVQSARAASIPGAGVPGEAPGTPRVRLVPVRGAPGDGNAALTARLREALVALGYVVQETADSAAVAVTAEVNVVPVPPRTERVEIQWIVSRRDGQELGRVVQLNELPAGRLGRFWGDIAYVAAQEAASGVEQVIRNARVP